MGSALAQGSSPNAMTQSFLFHGATLEGKQRGSRQPGGKWQKSKYHDKPAQREGPRTSLCEATTRRHLGSEEAIPMKIALTKPPCFSAAVFDFILIGFWRED